MKNRQLFFYHHTEAKESRETKVLKTSQVREILSQVPRACQGRKTLKK